MSLISTSVKRPVLVLVIMIALSGMGLFCYNILPRELFPDVEFPMVTVMTVYSGAGPDEIEELITKKLEEEVSTVEGLKHVYGTSQQGLSLIMAEFNLETDVDAAAADVRAKVDLVRSDLPEAAEDPITQKFDFNDEPVVQLAVSANRSLREVYFYAKERIKDQLSTVLDVASVEIVGGEEREIHILADQQRLRSYHLNISDLIGAVAMANIESPGGYIQQNRREYNIRLRGKFASLDEIRNLRINTGVEGVAPIYLKDIAEVRDSFKEIRDKIRSNGLACVGINVQKRAGGNTVAVDEGVKKKIAELDKLLPEDFEITVQNDQGPWITSSIQNVLQNMFIGVLLTGLALYLFLHTMRGVLVVSLSMPISVMTTFIIMYISGFSLNMMSLMGLAMTVGILVNNSILVLENITRYVQLGHDPKIAAVEGSGEIATAVSSTTLTNVVVFVPIAFMGGIIGQFFKDFGLTATFATMVSLFISFTLTPMMAGRLINPRAISTEGPGLFRWFGRKFDAGLADITSNYEKILRFALRFRWLIILLALSLLVGGFSLTRFIGGEFITNMDQGRISILIEMPTGTRLEETDAAVHQLEEVLKHDDVLGNLLVNTYSGIGATFGGDMGGASQGVNIAQINVKVKDKEDREPFESVKQIINRIRPKLAEANIPGARIKVFEEGGGGGAGAAIQVALVGDDTDKLRTLSEETMAMMGRLEGTVDIDSSFRIGQPEVRVIPDRERCKDCGITTSQLSQILAAHFEGLIASEYREGAYDYDIRVRSNESARENLMDVPNLTIMTPAGRKPLPELAKIEHKVGPAQLYRRDRQSQITVSCDATGRTPGDIVMDIDREMATIMKKYPGCNYVYIGDVEMMQDSFGRLGMAMIMATCLTYLLLAALLESFVQAFVIIFALPMSLVGVFVMMFIMGGTFSIFSIMSIIMLLGLVVNNSIVVIDYINVLRGKGIKRREAIVESCTTRLRPILMADITTIVALIPLALGLGWGGEMMASMAQAQIGGLMMDALGLIISPTVYSLVDDLANWVRRLIHAKSTDQLQLEIHESLEASN